MAANAIIKGSATAATVNVVSAYKIPQGFSVFPFILRCRPGLIGFANLGSNKPGDSNPLSAKPIDAAAMLVAILHFLLNVSFCDTTFQDEN